MKKKEKIILSDEIILNELKSLVNRMKKAIHQKHNNYEKDVIDPFMSFFEQVIFKDNLEDWKESEYRRQLSKTFGNHLGRFHQNLLCSLDDCYEPEEGGVDFVSENKKIIAEIKNKWNTTNAGSKAASFDILRKALSEKKYKGYKAYFVTIIPKTPKNYCEEFKTTSNVKKANYRKPRKDILSINAEYFYEKITGKKDVLKSIFYRLPELIKKLKYADDKLINNITQHKDYNYFLDKALKD